MPIDFCNVFFVGYEKEKSIDNISEWNVQCKILSLHYKNKYLYNCYVWTYSLRYFKLLFLLKWLAEYRGAILQNTVDNKLKPAIAFVLEILTIQ